MKTREIFEEIRKQKNKTPSLRVRLTLLVSAEQVFIILMALLISVLLESNMQIRSPLVLGGSLLVVSLLIGSVVTGFVAKVFFDPIGQLRKAMEKVADGDFSVRLEGKYSSKEIMEIYSGFNLMAHELAATEILQTDFVSNVSHEFKTPINAIEGYSMLLQGGENLDGEQREYVDKILFNTQRLSSLVGSILLLSKLENQQIPTDQTSYRLDEQIRQSIVCMEPAWEKKDIEFDVEMEKVEYIGNENMMRHVWDNLIGNAVKFSPRGGTVEIHLIRRGESIVFTVDDCGPGLTEEAQRHIYDKFYQADSLHKHEGNGLGLALVKRIVSIEKGEVVAENLKDGGCRFTVTLHRK